MEGGTKAEDTVATSIGPEVPRSVDSTVAVAGAVSLVPWSGQKVWGARSS